MCHDNPFSCSKKKSLTSNDGLPDYVCFEVNLTKVVRNFISVSCYITVRLNSPTKLLQQAESEKYPHLCQVQQR